MTLFDSKKTIFIASAAIGLLLLYIRYLAKYFILGTSTFEHPYIEFAGALIIGGLVLMLMIAILKSADVTKRGLYMIIALDDWNRYLWDGAVITQGINPYKYAPLEIIEGENSDNPDIIRLREYSIETRRNLDNYVQERYNNRPVPLRINHEYLRTIYPPVAQGVFAVAAFIGPINPDVLRGVYLFVEALTFFLLIKTLQAYGRDEKWAILYVLNPLLIYSGFNVLHMDILLMPPMLLTLLWVKKGSPMKAGVALAIASAVKLWPLLLAPIFFRRWRRQPLYYIAIAASVAVLSVVFNLPLLLSIGENSGLSAYTGEWVRNSFIFPMLFSLMEHVGDEPGRLSRIIVALSVTLLSLYYGFIAKIDDDKLPLALMVTTGALLFLSPTGYPWYLYWVLIFLPFVPSYGLALLSGLIGLYYTRYALGEREIHHIYEDIFVPLQFALPLLVIGWEVFRARNLQRDHNG